MSSSNLARETLQKARFFAEQAVLQKTSNRNHFIYFLEAAIVFGRSVISHAYAEHLCDARGNRRPGFKRWYETRYAALEGDPLGKFFIDQRSYILKEGPTGICRIISMSLHASVTTSIWAQGSVIRGTPWYRRDVQILWEDFRDAVMIPIRKWQKYLQLQSSCKSNLAQQANQQAVDDFYFDEPAWRHRPALEMLGEYFEKLEMFINDVETSWSL